MTRIVQSAALVAIAAVTWGPSRVDAQATARTLLDRAQQVLADPVALARVRSVEWSRSDGSRYRIVFPNRYRIDSASAAILFDGRQLSMWRSGAKAWTQSPVANQATLGMRNLSQYAVMFLLRPSAAYPRVSSEGIKEFGPLRGTTLVFHPSDSKSPAIRAIVDPVSAKMTGVVIESLVDEAYTVQAVSDHRPVDGVLVPHTIHTSRWTKQLDPLPGGRPVVHTLTNVRLNSVKPQDLDVASATGPS